MRRVLWLVVAVLSLALWAWLQRAPVPGTDGATVAIPDSTRDARPGDSAPATTVGIDADGYPGFLPREAHDTLRLIAHGGPFPHRQDGGVFQNRERLLPTRSRGYYREYTVRTPGARDRGARRIVSGGDPPSEYFYTDDHYRSFRRFAPARSAAR